MNWSRLRQQVDAAQKASGLIQKEIESKSGLSRKTWAQWKGPGQRNLPELESLARYAEACGAQLLIELVPKGSARRLLAVDDDMAEAAITVDMLDNFRRARVMAFLRAVPQFERGDWRALDVLLAGLKEELAVITDREAASDDEDDNEEDE